MDHLVRTHIPASPFSFSEESVPYDKVNVNSRRGQGKLSLMEMVSQGADLVSVTLCLFTGLPHCPRYSFLGN